MLTLYQGSGVGGFGLLNVRYDVKHWDRIKQNARRLIRARYPDDYDFLAKYSFKLHDATNVWQDEFCVLLATVPLSQYIELSELHSAGTIKLAAGHLSDVLSEIVTCYIRFIAVELDVNSSLESVSSPNLQVTSEVVERALADAEQLIRTRDAISAVDRVHTAFQGYLLEMANNLGILPDKDADITQLFKLIREKHPAFDVSTGEEIKKIVKAMATIIDALNPIRNRSSIAHPNEDLIKEPEAMLVVNSIRTLLHYLDTKTRS